MKAPKTKQLTHAEIVRAYYEKKARRQILEGLAALYENEKTRPFSFVEARAATGVKRGPTQAQAMLVKYLFSDIFVHAFGWVEWNKCTRPQLYFSFSDRSELLEQVYDFQIAGDPVMPSAVTMEPQLFGEELERYKQCKHWQTIGLPVPERLRLIDGKQRQRGERLNRHYDRRRQG